MPTTLLLPDPSAARHSLIDDVQGLSTGVVMCSLGLSLLNSIGLITGQTAGAAIILAHLTGFSFGLCFFLFSLPFYWLGYSRLGLNFTVKSVLCVAVLSALTDFIPTEFVIERLNPLLGVFFFGTVTGIGLLAVFRHGGSLGGFGIVALYIQDTFGIRAGYVQLAVDAILFLIAAFLFPPSVVLWSLAGAVILNGLIAFNHRRDWYVAR